MEKLSSLEMAMVKQKVEWVEVFTGFEGKNRYSVKDSYDNEIYFAVEKSSWLARLFLQFMRPLEVHVMNLDGAGVFKIVKPFRFFFHEGRVGDFNGKYYGKVKRRFSLLIKRISVEDPSGQELYDIKSEVMHPWTLKIHKNGQEVGEIIKKWSGVGKEIFTDADNFTIKFPVGAAVEEKALLLGALFLADLVYFEKKD